MSKGKSNVYYDVSSYIEIESMVATQVARPTEQLDAKEISTIVVDSLDDIQPYKYEKVCTALHCIVGAFVEQILFDLLCREMMHEILDRNIGSYFDTSNTNGKVGEKLLFLNAFLPPMPVFIRHSTSKVVSAERIVTKMEKQLKLETLKADLKPIAQKLVSLQSRTDSVPICLPWHEDDDTNEENINQGSAPILFVVLNEIERTENLFHVKQFYQFRQTAIWLRVLHPIDPRPKRKSAAVGGGWTQGVTSNEKLLPWRTEPPQVSPRRYIV